MTLVVNLMGPPGTGKSTMAAEIFAMLKWEGVNCELVGEFAKELVWEERHETMKDEDYLFAKQAHRLFRLQDKVDVIVTDRPLVLSVMYNDMYGDKSNEFRKYVLHTVNKYNNMNILLKRTKPYVEEGRVQTEAESNEMANTIIQLLADSDIDYSVFPATSESSKEIVKLIMQYLREHK